MKQLEMTPALEALIRQAVGPDANLEGIAVFESISLNTLPLPGKRGSLFEDATVSPSTLKLMVEHINGGKHLPLISDHDMSGSPKGRVFHAGLDFSEESGVELRTLFYLDPTEALTITKLNAGSLDEVSVSFLAEKFLCSECSWDYFEPGRMENVYSHTCGNGHHIGEDGVHGEMFGLRSFIELSLVASGAADTPKIVGKSQAKLAPEMKQLLTASGFDPDELVLQASIKKDDDTMADAELLTRLSNLSTEKGTLTAQLSAATEQVTSLTTARDAAVTELATVKGELETAKADLQAAKDASHSDDYAAAIKGFQTQLNALRVAGGEAELSEADLPKTVAELMAEIDSKTTSLTALLPAPGGKSQTADDKSNDGQTASFNASAYKLS